MAATLRFPLVTDGAKLYSRQLVLLAIGGTLLSAGAGCARPAAFPVYDQDGRMVRRIDYDTDRDGKLEARLYFRDGEAIRLEADSDEDGRVDRWEGYAAGGALQRLGTSSRRDGRADTWVIQAGTSTEVQTSTRRDGVIDSRDRYENGTLTRTERDTNFDGRPDQWQQFEQGRLRQLDLDTTLVSGRADRRLVYSAGGALDRIESRDANGAFVVVSDATP
jgi:hypothetical protein